MHKYSFLKIILFSLFFLSCQTPFTPENPEARSFAHLQNPIVFSTPITPAYSLLNKSKSFGDTPDKQYYIIIFDSDKGELFNKKLVTANRLFDRAFEDPISGNRFFMANGKNANDSNPCLYELKKSTGDIDNYIPSIPTSLGFMQRYTSSDGRAFISSYFLEAISSTEAANSQGFRLTVFNVEKHEYESVDKYLPEPYEENAFDENISMYFNMQGNRVGGYISTNQLFKMNLNDYSYKEIFKDNDINWYSRILCVDNKIFLGAVGTYKTNNHYAVILDLDGKVLLKQKIQSDSLVYYPSKIFNWNKSVYLIYGGINEADADGVIRNWLYKYNEATNQFERIESEALFGVSMRNMVYVCSNKLVMIDNLEGASFKAAAVDLNTMTQLYNKEIILY